MATGFLKKKAKSIPDQYDPPADIANYPCDADSYEIVGQVGRGAFASVYKAICKPKDNQEVALKVIELEKEETSEEKEKGGGNANNNWEEIQKEAVIMRRMHHPNIISCYASFTVETELWLVLPYLKGGSCADIMKTVDKFQNGFKDESILSTILFDVVRGINYCHNDGRIHRDIKAANILLSGSGVAQLSDFGVSGAIIEGGLRKPGRGTFTGSLWWMAPEVLQRENKHSFPADIWSLGITALELAYGKPPHSTQRPVKVMLTILQSSAPTIELYEKDDSNNKTKWSKDFRKFLNLCLQKDSEKRASSKDLLKHSWFKQAKDHTYIVENLLKFAPDLKIKKNRPLPKSIQPNENQNDEQKESLTFSFGTDNISAVMQPKKDETNSDLSSVPENQNIDNTQNNKDISNINDNDSTNIENNDNNASKVMADSTDHNDSNNNDNNNKDKSNGGGRFAVTEASISQSQPHSETEPSDNEQDDNDTNAKKKSSRFNVSYGDD